MYLLTDGSLPQPPASVSPYDQVRAEVLAWWLTFNVITSRDQPSSARYNELSTGRVLGQCSPDEVIAAGEAMIASGQAAIHALRAMEPPLSLPLEDSCRLVLAVHCTIRAFQHRTNAARANLDMLSALRPYGGEIASVPAEQWSEVAPYVLASLDAMKVETALLAEAMNGSMAAFMPVAQRWEIPLCGAH